MCDLEKNVEKAVANKTRKRKSQPRFWRTNVERQIRERRRDYVRAWRQRRKDLKKKVSTEENESENQRAYYHCKKDLKENDKDVEELFQKKLDDLQMKRKILDSNEDQKNVVQFRASQNLENVQLEQNKFLTQQLRIYKKSNECITPKVILHRNTEIPGVDTSNQLKEECEEHDDHFETDVPSFTANIEMEHGDEIKEEITIEENNFQCRICLSVGRRMSPLEEYEEIYKKLLFDNYQDQKENWFSTVQVCWECHALLRSVDRFQRKVRTAHNMLQSQQNDVSLSTLTTLFFSDSIPDTIYLIEADKQTDQLNSETDRDENPENNELLIEREKIKDELTRKRKIDEKKPTLKAIEGVETSRRVDSDLNGLKEVLDERTNEERVVFSDSIPDTIYLIEADKQTDQLNSETDRDENPENNELLIEREKIKDELTRKRKIDEKKPTLKAIEGVETSRRVDSDLNGLKEVLDERTNEERVVFSDSIPDTIYLKETDKQTDQLNSETDRDKNPENNELVIEREKIKDELTRKRKIVEKKPTLKSIEGVETFRRADSDLNSLKEVLDERRNEESYKRSRFRCSTCTLSFDDENELNEHNRECHDEAKKKKIKVSKAKTKLKKEYEGKIRLVIITMEELLEERRAEALKKNYLKFPYKCEYCITGFVRELTLKSHMETRHSKKSDGIKCKICNSTLGTKMSFYEHYKRHFRRYECIECGRRNNNICLAVKHYNEKHGRIETVFKCELCDFSTESHRRYDYHRNKHGTKKVECQVCSNTFVNKNDLKTHMFTVHGQSRRVYSCEECGKQYRAKSGLWAHAATHAPSPTYCLECDAHFTSQLGLKSHLKRHSKHTERRFVCNECDAIFVVKKSLQRHIELMHLNNTELACNKCNKVFINSASLKTHREVVHE